jgi:hypothetical protein
MARPQPLKFAGGAAITARGVVIVIGVVNAIGAASADGIAGTGAKPFGAEIIR